MTNQKSTADKLRALAEFKRPPECEDDELNNYWLGKADRNKELKAALLAVADVIEMVKIYDQSGGSIPWAEIKAELAKLDEVLK